jgi:hypothetical protein
MAKVVDIKYGENGGFFDASRCIADAPAVTPAEELWLDAQFSEDFAISVTFETRWRCGVCGEGFSELPEGVPVLTHDATGFEVPACPACVVALASEFKKAAD